MSSVKQIICKKCVENLYKQKIMFVWENESKITGSISDWKQYQEDYDTYG